MLPQRLNISVLTEMMYWNEAVSLSNFTDLAIYLDNLLFTTLANPDILFFCACTCTYTTWTHAPRKYMTYHHGVRKKRLCFFYCGNSLSNSHWVHRKRTQQKSTKVAERTTHSLAMSTYPFILTSHYLSQDHPLKKHPYPCINSGSAGNIINVPPHHPYNYMIELLPITTPPWGLSNQFNSIIFV